jgi:hypothetical protein
VVLSPTETITTEPASVLNRQLLCRRIDALDFANRVFAAMDGSFAWATAIEVATESVISDMAVKASALIICPFLF